MAAMSPPQSLSQEDQLQCSLPFSRLPLILATTCLCRYQDYDTGSRNFSQKFEDLNAPGELTCPNSDPHNPISCCKSFIFMLQSSTTIFVYGEDIQTVWITINKRHNRYTFCMGQYFIRKFSQGHTAVVNNPLGF